MKLFLVSDSFISVRENGVTVEKIIDESNAFLLNLKKFIRKYDNFVFIPNIFNAIEQNEFSAKQIDDAFQKQLKGFKQIVVLDNRNKMQAKEILQKADFIFLQGGKLEEQNKFLKEINFVNIVPNADAVVVGKSAGAMNMCKIVYWYPEEDDEVVTQKWLKGLGLVDLVLIPHFNLENGNQYCPEHSNLLEDYFKPDSFKYGLYALKNGSYILVEEKYTLYGECYLIKNGKVEKICDDGSTLVLK